MKRLYHDQFLKHFRNHRQMLFVTGPRQVGKTTLGLLLKDDFEQGFGFNWDIEQERELIQLGAQQIAETAGLRALSASKPLLFFDELHKYKDWRNFLKGLFDEYEKRASILVTGSARLDVYNHGGDSLMGRYFMYRVHPLSVGELCHSEGIPNGPRDAPKEIDPAQFDSLWRFGGFPEPFLKASDEFSNHWKRLRSHQLFQEDLRDLSRVHEIAQLELLAKLMQQQAGHGTSYSSLARKVRVTVATVQSWLKILTSLYYCFEIRPWTANVSRSLLKEPKHFLYDWSLCQSDGQRAENLVACHLLKTIHLWNDCGFGDYGLHYLRDKSQREVDFLVSKDSKPYMLVEVKLSNSRSISPALQHFQKQLNAPFAFQVVFDLPYVDSNCFIGENPLIVPAKTFLSQLV